MDRPKVAAAFDFINGKVIVRMKLVCLLRCSDAL